MVRTLVPILNALLGLRSDQLPRRTQDGAPVSGMSDAPIELIPLDEPYEGVISACREGEPSFSHGQDVADAIMTALASRVRRAERQRTHLPL